MSRDRRPCQGSRGRGRRRWIAGAARKGPSCGAFAANGPFWEPLCRPPVRGAAGTKLVTPRKVLPMRKLILAGAAILSLSTALPAFAQDNDAAGAAGATVGATTGGTIGFILGGPVGAIIGGFSGAVLGGTVSEAAVSYAGNNPVDPIFVDADLDVGVKVSSDVTLYPIEGEDDLSYFYANGRVWIVSTSTREIVSSPGFVVPEAAVAYVKANPTTSVTIDGDVSP